MDLRRFITFKTVVEEGSFLRAAQKLCYTQSTVTFHIQQLEQELAIPLFEKIGRRMCLTAAGKKVLPHVYDLTKVMASIRQAARQDDEPGGELRVATGETLLAYKMPRVLQRVLSNALESAPVAAVAQLLQHPRCVACRRGRFGCVLPGG